jgi:hypothetical protein
VAGIGPTTAGEEGEALVETGHHLLELEGVEPGGGQLDRQREPIQSGDQLLHLVAGVSVRVEVRGRGAGSFDEELDRRIRAVGARQRRDDAHLLAADAEALPAGGDHRDARASGEQLVDESGDGIDDLLAVVEQEHELRVVDHRRDPSGGLDPRAGVDPEAGRHLLDGGVGVGASQLGEDHRRGAVAGQASAHLQQHARLSDPARPDEGDEPVGGAHGEDLADQVLPSDQRGGRDREPGVAHRRRHDATT